MAAMGTSSAFMQKAPQDVTKVLVTAIFEWLLISMLFIDAIFSYIITKFAYYCGLQTPCLLCSRLDHVLGKEKLGYYWDLFCGNHKSEVSSLVLCHAHHKLVDVHGICESCLFSFATINRSNAVTYRLLVGKLGDDANFDFDQDPLLGGHKPCLSSGTLCSCCNQPCISRGHSQKLIQTKKFGSEAELDVPLSRDIEHNRKELRKGQDESYISVRATHVRDSGLHPLSHVGYTELKVTSDTESEVHFSDDDNASGLIHERCDPKEDISAQYAEPRIITPALIDPASVPKPSLLASQAQVDPNSNGSTSVASTVAFGHGLEELNWQKGGSKADFPALTEPILDNTPPSSNAMEAPVEVSKGRKDVTGTRETDQISAAEPRELYKGGVRALTTSETEQWIGKDSSRVTEDLKVLLSQLSGNRGNEQSTNEMSPKLSSNSGDLKASDSSNSIGLQLLQKRISLERNESGLSLDGSIVSEIEGESVVDRLKRQVEHDKKIMSVLYKELEEERNASAVASDQAMAMITRLQEEKAALRMEALQHLRMMEEQAEYDNEALQKIDDLLVEKEKEIQDLEAELEFYRRKFPNESMLEDLPETTCDIQARDIVVDHSESSSIEHCASVPKHVDTGRPHTYSTMPFSDEDGGRVKTSLLDFEDEKIQILQCLEKLEKALSLFSNNGVNSDSSKGDCSENGGHGVGKSNLHNGDGGSQQNDAIRENGLPMQHQVPVTSGHISSLENPLLNGKQSETYCSGQNSEELCQVTDLASLPILISDLNKRLKALEADRGFLERTMNSLRYGEEGLKFIEQIASLLGELRKVGIRRDQTSA
ncbi:myosin-binding protein 1 isoform X2 [Prunus avium]|uniref:Myosin-binding protein 1 isoform X2 n=1 Tax=Prunus avium TaxID=42229 RepID=A0A6P5S210_PRUAV|nr:myosin-binding protein 1 isoform X2 [Prunus avium]